MNRMQKAFEMNSFAVENGFASSMRGCPGGFAAIESRLDGGEYAVMCWTAQNIRNAQKRIMFEGTSAFALTLGRLILAGKTPSGYKLLTYPIWSIMDIKLSRNKLFSKDEITITFTNDSVRFLCRGSAKNVCAAVIDEIKRQT